MRPVGPSISDGYEAISRLTQPLEFAVRHDCERKTVIRYLKLHRVEKRYQRLSEKQIDERVELNEQGA